MVSLERMDNGFSWEAVPGECSSRGVAVIPMGPDSTGPVAFRLRLSVGMHGRCPMDGGFGANEGDSFCSETVANPMHGTRYGTIEPVACRSWSGIAIGFRCTAPCNLFRLYEVREGSRERSPDRMDLVAETEDFQVSLGDRIGFGRTYVVEGYAKVQDGEFQLVAASAPWKPEEADLVRKGEAGSPSVSVVLPVYDMERLLPRTLDCLALSAFSDLEIICVDDGSSDRSAEILDWYAKEYPFVKVVHNDGNLGLDASRGIAIGMAKGKYVHVMDSDDMVHPYMHAVMLAAIEESGTDVAVSRIVVRNAPGKSTMLHVGAGAAATVIRTRQEMQELQDTLESRFVVSLCNKLVSRELLLRTMRDEDRGHGPQRYVDESGVYDEARGFVLVRDAYYIWEQRHKSA